MVDYDRSAAQAMAGTVADIGGMFGQIDISAPPPIRSITDLARLVEAYRHDSRYWIFRGGREPLTEDGGAKALENLTPHIGRQDLKRTLHNKEMSRPYTAKEEKNLLDHFKRAARAHVAGRDPTDLEWLSIARHHGLPTRLLDWSESLFIAAYFAVAEAEQEKDKPVIYATVAPKELRSDYTGVLSDIRDVVLYRPSHLTPRITAQRGVFTVHPKPTRSFMGPHIVKIEFKASDTAITHKMNLHYAGINHATLFPDLTGIAQQLQWQYKWDHLPPYRDGHQY